MWQLCLLLLERRVNGAGVCVQCVSACAPTICDASLISNADAAITTLPKVFVLSISVELMKNAGRDKALLKD